MSQIGGYEAVGAGTTFANGIYCISGEYNGHDQYDEWNGPLYIRYVGGDFTWAIVNSDNQHYYTNVTEAVSPPLLDWLPGELGLFPPVVLFFSTRRPLPLLGRG